MFLISLTNCSRPLTTSYDYFSSTGEGGYSYGSFFDDPSTEVHSHGLYSSQDFNSVHHGLYFDPYVVSTSRAFYTVSSTDMSTSVGFYYDPSFSSDPSDV